MKNFIFQSHHYLAYVALLLLIFATFNGIFGYFGKRDFKKFDQQINLFTMISLHTMLLLGIALLFVDLSYVDLNTIMSNPESRKMFVEHPFVNIIGVVLATIGNAQAKRKLLSRNKYKVTMLYFGAAFVLILSRIPFDRLFG